MTQINPDSHPELARALALASNRERLLVILGYTAHEVYPSYGERLIVDGVAFELLSPRAAYYRRTRVRLYMRCPLCATWVTPGRLRLHSDAKHVDTADTIIKLDSRVRHGTRIITTDTLTWSIDNAERID